jgi:hypothetical protein
MRWLRGAVLPHMKLFTPTLSSVDWPARRCACQLSRGAGRGADATGRMVALPQASQTCKSQQTDPAIVVVSRIIRALCCVSRAGAAGVRCALCKKRRCNCYSDNQS